MPEATGLLTYALLFFLVYLYLPHTFFKFWAELSIDLGLRRDATQLEEIISVALPSFLLNVQAAVAYFLLCLTPFGWRVIDRDIAAALIGGDNEAVAAYVKSGDWSGCAVYLLLLYVAAAFNGWAFGRAVLHLSSTPGAEDGLDQMVLRGAAFANNEGDFRGLFRAIAWKIWYPFYHESLVPFFTWSVRQPLVFVRTIDQRLYHGRFIRYEKAASGELEGIRLEEVCRYCYDECDARFRRGLLPLSDFQGTLYIKSEQIADLNRVNPDRLYVLIAELQERMEEYRQEYGLPPVEEIEEEREVLDENGGQ